MPKPGRVPAPTALKIVKGEKKSRINTREPKAPVSETPPRPPTGMSERARKVWNAHVKDLHKGDLLSERDVEAFAVYCQAVAFEREAAISLEEGLLVKGSREREVLVNPAWRQWRDAAQMVLSAGARFGMTPSDRQSIVMPHQDRDGEARRLLS